MYVDVALYKHTYRIIAIYWPHAGYPTSYFNACVDEVRIVILDAAAKGIRPIFGGDLNTQMHTGRRGQRLQEVLAETGMIMCNDPTTLTMDQAWTFRSYLGTTRTLDYIGIPDFLNCTFSEASDLLDLGSDHRAVIAHISIPVELAHQYVTRSRKRDVDWLAFEQKVGADRVIQNANGIQTLEDQLGHLAEGCSRKRYTSQLKAWDSDELRELRVQRRNAVGAERAQMSKMIWRKTRQKLRRWKTERATSRLEEFSRLKDLERIHAHPVSRKGSQKPDVTKCSDLLREVFASANGSPNGVGVDKVLL